MRLMPIWSEHSPNLKGTLQCFPITLLLSPSTQYPMRYITSAVYNVSDSLGLDRNMILEWNLTEIGSEGVNWIRLARDRALVNTVMDLWVS